MNNQICIIQLADKKYYEQRKNCVNSVSSYCKSMGYEWKGLIGTLDKSTHIAYQKPLALSSEIDNFQYVGWVDMDVAITNRNFNLLKYLEDKNQDVTICRDPSFFNGGIANSGVIFFKRSELSKNILSQWWKSRITGTDKHWRHQDQAGNGDADQQYLNKILKKHKIPIQNPHDLNIYPKNFKCGDFAIHFMGHKPEDFDPFVEVANSKITNNKLLEKFWLIYKLQSLDRIQRYYEYGLNENSFSLRFSPEEILYCAKEIININIPN